MTTCQICETAKATQIVLDQYHCCADCAGKLTAYTDRVQNRLERLQRAAQRTQTEGRALVDQAHRKAELIPFGQPILIGHHSEGRDRRYRAGIERTFRRGFETLKRAAELQRRADSPSTAISSDDPAAVVKLKERLETLRKGHQLLLQANQTIRAMNKRKAPLDEMIEAVHGITGIDKTRLKIIMTFYGDQPGKYRTLSPTNNSAEIRRVQERISDLQQMHAQAAAAPQTEQQYGDIRIVQNREANRVQIFFPGKPAPTTIKLLKGRGFHWTPSIGAWQRLLNNGAIYDAESIVKQIQKEQ